MDVAPAFIFFGVMVRVCCPFLLPAPWRASFLLTAPTLLPSQVYGVKGLRAKLLRDHRD